MNKFAKALESTMTDADRDHAAAVSSVQSLQSSLYQRMKKTRGHSGAGTTAWMMIRLAQPKHRDHEDAEDAVVGMTATDIGELLEVCRAAKRTARGSTAALLDEVTGALVEHYRNRRGVDGMRAQAAGDS